MRLLLIRAAEVVCQHGRVEPIVSAALEPLDERHEECDARLPFESRLFAGGVGGRVRHRHGPHPPEWAIRRLPSIRAIVFKTLRSASVVTSSGSQCPPAKITS